MRLFFALAMIVFIAGCMPGSPMHLATLADEELQTVETKALCNAYHDTGASRYRTELERRHVIPNDEWELINARKVAIGMSEMGMLAAHGIPGIFGNENRTVVGGSASTQWVYRNCDRCPARYIYTSGGRVVAFQD